MALCPCLGGGSFFFFFFFKMYFFNNVLIDIEVQCLINNYSMVLLLNFPAFRGRFIVSNIFYLA